MESPMVPVPQQMSKTVVVGEALHQSAISLYSTSAPAVFTSGKKVETHQFKKCKTQGNILFTFIFGGDNTGSKHLQCNSQNSKNDYVYQRKKQQQNNIIYTLWHTHTVTYLGRMHLEKFWISSPTSSQIYTATEHSHNNNTMTNSTTFTTNCQMFKWLTFKECKSLHCSKHKCHWRQL